MKYLLLAMSMALAIIGQTFLKRGVLASGLVPNISSLIKTIFSPFVLIGLGAYAISTLFWLFVFISFFVLKEPITQYKLIGIALIIFGVYFLFK